MTPEDFAMLARDAQRGRSVPRPAALRLAHRLPARRRPGTSSRGTFTWMPNASSFPRKRLKGNAGRVSLCLHGPALEIIQRLVASRAEGKLFLNARGRPWKKFAVCNRFDRLHLFLGMKNSRSKAFPLSRCPGSTAAASPTRCS